MKLKFRYTKQLNQKCFCFILKTEVFGQTHNHVGDTKISLWLVSTRLVLVLDFGQDFNPRSHCACEGCSCIFSLKPHI